MDWLGFKCLLETAMKKKIGKKTFSCEPHSRIILATFQEELDWIYVSSYNQTHIDTYLPELSLDVLAICQSHSI